MKIFKNYKTLLIAFVLTFVGVGNVMAQDTGIAYFSRPEESTTALSVMDNNKVLPAGVTSSFADGSYDFSQHEYDGWLIKINLHGYCYKGQYFTIDFDNFKYEVTAINIICKNGSGKNGSGTFTSTDYDKNVKDGITIAPKSESYTTCSASKSGDVIKGLKSVKYFHDTGEDGWTKGKWVDFQSGTGTSSFLQIAYNIPTIKSKITSKTLRNGDTFTLTKDDITWTNQGAFEFSDITFASSNTDVVSVDGAILTAKSAGTATITATLKNNTAEIAKTTFDIEVEDYMLDATIDYGITDKTSFDDGKKDVVIFKREFKEGQWTTLALPFDVTLKQLNKTFKYASVCELASITRMDIEGGKIYYRTQDHLKANVPVLAYIKPNDDNLYKFEGVTLVPPTAEQLTHTITEGVQLVPVYKKTNYTVYNDIQNNLWFLYGGKFYDWSYLSDMYPFQAYIYNTTASSGAKSFTFVPEGDVETSISGTVISMPESATNNAIYNIAGQRVNSNAKGLLIKNGKKIFVK